MNLDEIFLLPDLSLLQSLEKLEEELNNWKEKELQRIEINYIRTFLNVSRSQLCVTVKCVIGIVLSLNLEDHFSFGIDKIFNVGSSPPISCTVKLKSDSIITSFCRLHKDANRHIISSSFKEIILTNVNDCK